MKRKFNLEDTVELQHMVVNYFNGIEISSLEAMAVISTLFCMTCAGMKAPTSMVLPLLDKMKEEYPEQLKKLVANTPEKQ